MQMLPIGFPLGLAFCLNDLEMEDHGLQTNGMWVRKEREDLIIIPKPLTGLLNFLFFFFLYWIRFKKRDTSSRYMKDII